MCAPSLWRAPAIPQGSWPLFGSTVCHNVTAPITAPGSKIGDLGVTSFEQKLREQEKIATKNSMRVAFRICKEGWKDSNLIFGMHSRYPGTLFFGQINMSLRSLLTAWYSR